MFSEKYKQFWKEFGSSKKMVLSTSLDNIVTSRMMSVVAIEGKCEDKKYMLEKYCGI